MVLLDYMYNLGRLTNKRTPAGIFVDPGSNHLRLTTYLCRPRQVHSSCLKNKVLTDKLKKRKAWLDYNKRTGDNTSSYHGDTP